jgi:hypothetical protein
MVLRSLHHLLVQRAVLKGCGAVQAAPAVQAVPAEILHPESEQPRIAVVLVAPMLAAIARRRPAAVLALQAELVEQVVHRRRAEPVAAVAVRERVARPRALHRAAARAVLAVQAAMAHQVVRAERVQAHLVQRQLQELGLVAPAEAEAEAAQIIPRMLAARVALAKNGTLPTVRAAVAVALQAVSQQVLERVDPAVFTEAEGEAVAAVWRLPPVALVPPALRASS